MRSYRAIFFDWDGTAVLGRTGDASRALQAMGALLDRGFYLLIISGTTYENICQGRLHTHFTAAQKQRLFLGLARGNSDYAFDAHSGEPLLLHDATPALAQTEALHEVCFSLHKFLLRHGIPTDVVFSRPNYCKIDLTVEHGRNGQLFLQEGEAERVNHLLKSHSLAGGLKGLIEESHRLGDEHGLSLQATTDAKYLEVGFTTKSDNVNRLLKTLQNDGVQTTDCCFWGDEYGQIAPGIWGSDAQMITPASSGGDFFSVSTLSLPLPERVKDLGGSVSTFLEFLEKQGEH